ncbi:uncharacterized protein LOC144104068 [Amblyomma americanum]
MANGFPGFQSWPTAMLALRRDVLKNFGIHYFIEAGRRTVLNNNNAPQKRLPDTLNNGWVVRFFMYAAEIGKECYMSVYLKGGVVTKFWYVRIDTGSGKVQYGKQEGDYSFSYPRRDSTYTIKKGEIYTISIRVEAQQYFDTYFNNNKLDRANMKAIRGYEWKLWYDTGDQQRILSLHVSNESGSAVAQIENIPHVDDFWMSLGSYGIFSLKYTGGASVSVNIHQSNQKLSRQFPVGNNTKKDDVITCNIRMTSKHYLILFSFSDKPTAVPPYDVFHLLQVDFSGNLVVQRATYVTPV